MPRMNKQRVRQNVKGLLKRDLTDTEEQLLNFIISDEYSPKSVNVSGLAQSLNDERKAKAEQALKEQLKAIQEA